MPKSVLELAVQTGKWDSGLRKAQSALDNFTSSQGGFQQAMTKSSADMTAFVRMMGNIDSNARTSKGQLNDYKSSFEQLTLAYRNLSDAEKNGDIGKTLSATLDSLRTKIQSTKQQIDDLNLAMNGTGGGDIHLPEIKGDMFNNMLSVFGGNLMTKAVDGVMQLGDAIGSAISQSAQLAQEGEGVMLAFQRLDSPGLLDNLREATHGTVSDLELMKAAVQFNDFNLPVEELGTMLAFAQQKAKDTGQSVDYMVSSIVTGLGRQSKQILDNLGISAAEIKERMEEGGDMTTAVAAIIRDQMSRAGGYVETAADRAARAAADQQNAMLALGQELLPLQQGAASVFNSMTTGALQVTAFLVRNKEAVVSVAAAIAAYTVVANAHTIATKAMQAATMLATAAQNALNLAMKANPIGLAIAGVTAAITALGLFSDETDEATEAMQRQRAEAERQRQTIGNAVGDVEAKFKSLQKQWNALKTDAEKTKFIDDNKNAFSELSLNIKSVTDAQNILIDQAPKVIEALKSVAEAEAYSDLYKQSIKKKAEEWGTRTKPIIPLRQAKAGDYVNMKSDEAKSAGLTTGDFQSASGNPWANELTKAGAEKLNKYREESAKNIERLIEKGYDDEIARYGALFDEAQQRALKAQSDIAGLMSSGGKGEKDTTKTTTKEKTAEQKVQEDINTLLEEALTADQSRRSEIRKEITALQQQLQEYKDIKNIAEGILPKDKNAVFTMNIDGDDAQWILEKAKEIEGVITDPKKFTITATTTEALQKVQKLTADIEGTEVTLEVKPKTDIAGSLKHLQDELTKLQAKQKDATDSASWRALGDQIKAAQRQISIFKGEIPANEKAVVTFSADTSAVDQWRKQAVKMGASISVSDEKGNADAKADTQKVTVDMTVEDQSALDKLRELTKEQDVTINYVPKVKGDTPQFDLATQKIAIQAELDASALKVDETTFKTLLEDSIKNGITGMDVDFTTIGEQLSKGLEVKDEVWDGIINKYNELREQMGLEPIVIDVKTGGVKEAEKDTKSLSKGWQAAAQSVGTLSSALQGMEDPSVKIAGIVGQAIANIALGFAQSTAKSAGLGVWGWIAAIVAGTATMVSTISSIHSATGHANGGIAKRAAGGFVPGTNYSGDNVLGMVDGVTPVGLNSGELILNTAQQNSIATTLQGSGMENLRLSTEVGAEEIIFILDNRSRRRGRGEYVTSKSR